jgi:hypothetical protein
MLSHRIAIERSRRRKEAEATVNRFQLPSHLGSYDGASMSTAWIRLSIRVSRFIPLWRLEVWRLGFAQLSFGSPKGTS